MKKLLLIIAAFVLIAGHLHAQTGNYSQTLPFMQSVSQATPVTFTGTPSNASSGILSCSWLGCQDVGMPNPTFFAQIWIDGGWQYIAQHNATSLCGSVSYSGNLGGALIDSAIASGGGNEIQMRVWVTDACQAGTGCSCCNDPLISNLTLTYTFSNALFNVTNTTPCPGKSVQFNDTTGTTFISRKWYFPGGTPATATGLHPTVTYNTPGNYTVTLVRTTAAGTDSTIKTSYIQVQTPPPAVISPGGPTTFCAGGSVLLSANTGAGLTYQWQKNSVNIVNATLSSYSANATGSYRAIITSANTCSTTSNIIAVTLNGKPSAVISAGGPVTFCPGGSVLLTANTGTGFTYVWKKNTAAIAGATNNTYSATATGDYKVTITNLNGCSRTSNVISVTVNTPVATVTPQGPTTFCNGGGVTLNANTGTGLTYQWRKGTTNIVGATNSSYTAFTGGTYRAAVTNGCGTATSSAVTVTVNPVPAANITTGGPTTFCTGSSVVLSANTGTGLTYQWKKNGSDISGGTASSYNASSTGSYTARVTNSSGCTALSNAINVTANNTAAVITAGGPTTFCVGDSVVLTANGGANLTYQWLKNNVNITGQTNQSYAAYTAGNYKVIVNNTVTGCAKTSGAVTVVVNCRMAEDQYTLDAEIIPNPFNHAAKIIFKNRLTEPVSITVFNEQGQTVEHLEAGEGTHETSLGENLAAGIYFVRLKSGDMVKTIRLVRNE